MNYKNHSWIIIGLTIVLFFTGFSAINCLIDFECSLPVKYHGIIHYQDYGALKMGIINLILFVLGMFVVLIGIYVNKRNGAQYKK